MAAGFTLDKVNLKDFENYILEDFLKSNISNENIFSYESEVSSLALNQDFYEDLKKLEPFGTGNPVPTFMLSPGVTILSASSVRTLASIEMNHSRPPDLKSSSYVSLPFAWITGPATDPSSTPLLLESYVVHLYRT